MKRIFTSLLSFAVVMCTIGANAQNKVHRKSNVTRDVSGISGNGRNLWSKVADGQMPSKELQVMHPSHFMAYRLDELPLRYQLFNLDTDPAHGMVIAIPMPDGSYRDFKVWQAPMMPDELAVQYPDIKTFNGEAVNDRRVTAKFDFTLYGFHAMVFEQDNVSFIDPFDNYHDGYYMVHYKKDETRAYSNRMKCEVKSDGDDHPIQKSLLDLHKGLPSTNLSRNTFAALPGAPALTTTNGTIRRNYRLALSADHFYCQSATGLPSPTIAQALSKMTTTMNRVNGVYNRELSVQLNFVTNETSLIWESATGSVNGTDPFTAIDANPNACLTQNQTSCDGIIGSANYDIGHVFTTNGGGLAAVGIVCNASQKAQGVTGSSTPVGDGFDIDYVAHEMGHEFGSSHTFNNNLDGSCSTNYSAPHAYEAGSGATIMDYAGICLPDDLQPHSDPYFSTSSLLQITAKLVGTESVCPTTAPTGNVPATFATFAPIYNIPYKTPFEFTGPTASITAADTATTYQWYEWNLGSTTGTWPESGKRLNQTYVTGPLFRSYQPVYNATRIFPNINMVLAGTLSNAGTEGAEGEKTPDTARYLTFKMAVRTILNGYGCVTLTDDSIHLNVSATGAASAYGGFKVLSQGSTGIVYTGGSTQPITWAVVGTNAAPVNAANVDIYMSTDGGFTWPYTIGTFPNTGTASVTIPNPAVTTTTARIKVKGNGNVFFNINTNNFTVNPGATTAPITGTFTVCPGATTTLADVTPGGTWTSGATGVATVGSANGVVLGVTAGTATISYIVGTGTVTQIVTVNPAPNAGTITGSTAVCISQTTSLTDGATGGTWSSTNTARATVDAFGVVTGVSAGAVTISYTVTNSCGTVAATKAMTVSAATAVAPVTGTTAICTGTPQTLGDVTPTGTWSSGNTAVATVGSSSGIVNGVAPGTAVISYGVTNAAGCVSSSVATVTVNTTPSGVISPAGPVSICTGGSALLSAATGYSYQWQIGGGSIFGATNATYSATGAGNYNVIITNGSCITTSSTVNVTVGSGSTVVPSVSISAIPGLVVCSGTSSVTFNATSVNGGATPVYQWFVNSAPVGTGGTTYTYTPANGDVVTCQLTSSNSCASPATVTTSVTMTIAPPSVPSVSINASPGATVCTGNLLTVTAAPVNGGTAPAYLWTVNGVNVATGPFYSYIPANGDIIGCTMTSNLTCVTTTTAIAAPLTVHVQAPSANTITVSVASTSIVAGQTVTFTAFAPNGGATPAYQWYINGTAVPGATSATYVTDSLQNGQIVSCAETSSVLCAGPHTVISSGVTMLVSSAIYSIGGGEGNIELVPNPNRGEFIVKGSLAANTDQQVTISITNMLGQSVFRKEATATSGNLNERITLQNTLPSGMYLVSVTSGEEHIVFNMVISK